jgi:hypothetical protein
MTLDPEARKIAIGAYRKTIESTQRALRLLVDGSTHEVVKHGESAACRICGTDFGWWCPKSPDHSCCYNEDGWCDHCGEPEERK